MNEDERLAAAADAADGLWSDDDTRKQYQRFLQGIAGQNQARRAFPTPPADSKTTAWYRVILVLGIDGLSTRDFELQVTLRDRALDVLGRALQAEGLPQPDIDDQGDRLIAVFPASISPARVIRMAEGLRYTLDHANCWWRPGAQLRLRVALHLGAVTRDNHGWSGYAVLQALRMQEAPELRGVFDDARPDEHLALILSGEMYRFSQARGTSFTYTPVTARYKEYSEECWISVPGHRPSPEPNTGPAPGADGGGEGQHPTAALQQLPRQEDFGLTARHEQRPPTG
jgi:hypothetical protein